MDSTSGSPAAAGSTSAPAESSISADGPAPGSPVLSDRVGSFPWSVLHDRHPALLAQVLDGHPWPPAVRAAIDRLGAEIAGPIQPLTDTAPDAPDWARWAVGVIGRSWYDVPFLWAENYFYRKLLAATGYLEPGPWQGIDPFGPVKDAELAGPAVDDELAALEGLPALAPDERLDALLLAALWGNRADLGFLIQAGSPEGPRIIDDGEGLVADDREPLRRLLAAHPRRVTLIADNAGRELLPDLVLIDELLARGVAEVVLEVKPRPYFVSDATPADVLAALHRLGTGPSVARGIGHRLRTALRTGALLLRADPFSVTPFGYQQLFGDGQTAELGAAVDPISGPWSEPATELSGADLTILKGDLNYRRLIGDRHWPATTPFADLTGYFPGPVLALRTLKSEVVAGLDPATVTRLDATGTPWRTSGEHGLIQFRP